jgi:hypothetical protein
MHMFFGLEFSGFSQLAAQALCAMLASFLATGLVAVTSAQRFEGMNFQQRFAFLLRRYTLPTGVFALAMYWLVFGLPQS